jgi:hypothetical protein
MELTGEIMNAMKMVVSIYDSASPPTRASIVQAILWLLAESDKILLSGKYLALTATKKKSETAAASLPERLKAVIHSRGKGSERAKLRDAIDLMTSGESTMPVAEEIIELMGRSSFWAEPYTQTNTASSYLSWRDTDGTAEIRKCERGSEGIAPRA